MKRLPAWLMTLAAVAASAAPPHQHGIARADIAVDPGHVTVLLQLPLDSVAGFERAPRNDAERAAIAAALARLRDAAALVRIDPAAACTVVEVHVPQQLVPATDEHADVDAGFDFDCQDAAQAAFIELRLFAAFPRLVGIDIQLATAKGQAMQTLQRPATRIPLR